ncbi:MAG TPA: nuclear transport factor 2 family protein [Usitatibacteraceae bacterium]
MRLLLMGLLLTAGVNAVAQERLPPGVRGGDSAMATRSVSKYLQLERDLQDAIRDKNADTVKRLLAADFEVHGGEGINAASLDDWLQRELRATIKSAGVRDMNVREFDDIAVVSFFLDRGQTVKGRIASSTSYVVDVWRQSAGQLQVRYITRPAKPAPAPKRPSGRE